MCRAVVPRVGAGEREVTLTVNGKTPSRARTGVGGRKVERDPRHLGPRQCPTGLSSVLDLATTSNYGPIAMMSNLVKFMPDPSPDASKDLGSLLVTSLICCFLRDLNPKSGS